MTESIELYLTDREPTTHLARYTNGTLIPTVTVYTVDGPVVLNLGSHPNPSALLDFLAAEFIGLAWRIRDMKATAEQVAS